MINNILYRAGFFAFLLLLFLAGGCMKQGIPLYYHTLSNPGQASVSPPQNDLPTILVGPVRVASFLDQKQLVKQRTSNSVSLIEQHRWAGNLSEMLSNALITQLSQMLNNEKVYSFPNTTSGNGLRLELDFLHFEEDQNRMAIIEARWRILSEDNQTILHSATSHYKIPPATQDYDALVKGLSQGLTRLSQEISAKILSLTSSADKDLS
ncbi:MAG: PqiC family protein [Proteobacteria bacterium]|nr:PqiC family protein [Pseudomonadota bacterium]MBU1418011.1 PqiC family protein [Pseudomonadota bacterium]MBU1455938.1 PqiC family protein [Pseudomonadota bacterium]